MNWIAARGGMLCRASAAGACYPQALSPTAQRTVGLAAKAGDVAVTEALDVGELCDEAFGEVGALPCCTA